MPPPPPSLADPMHIQPTTAPSSLTSKDPTKHPKAADPSTDEPIDLNAPLKQAPTNLIAPEPEHCPGPESQSAGKSDSCAGCPNQQICASAPKGPDPDLPVIRARMKDVKHKVMVMSGKGGVGKSTFSALLAYAFAADDEEEQEVQNGGAENGKGQNGTAGDEREQNGHALEEQDEEYVADEELNNAPQVGLMDTDICGPSIPGMLGVINESVHISASGITPVYVTDNLCAMSIQFILPERDKAIIWRGARKNGMIKKFLMEVEWGALDWMVVDTPPGTSDEHLSVVAFMMNQEEEKLRQENGTNTTASHEEDPPSLQKSNTVAVSQSSAVPSINQLHLNNTSPSDAPPREKSITAALLITTPQELSLLDVRKQFGFCRKASIPILGLIENMSGFICPECSYESQIFQATTGGAEALAKEMGVRFLGRVPLDPRIGMAGDFGESGNFLEAYPDSKAVVALKEVVKGVKGAVKEMVDA
ncbi:MAG: cytosolic Fe-S cluster assembly factor nbp35 [Alyxoria varia]|nr:MAG: cytosolic Fe-S cluster assembly factor nbp35 [Alyxoria varia]